MVIAVSVYVLQQCCSGVTHSQAQPGCERILALQQADNGKKISHATREQLLVPFQQIDFMGRLTNCSTRWQTTNSLSQQAAAPLGDDNQPLPDTSRSCKLRCVTHLPSTSANSTQDFKNSKPASPEARHAYAGGQQHHKPTDNTQPSELSRPYICTALLSCRHTNYC